MRRSKAAAELNRSELIRAGIQTAKSAVAAPRREGRCEGNEDKQVLDLPTRDENEQSDSEEGINWIPEGGNR